MHSMRSNRFLKTGRKILRTALDALCYAGMFFRIKLLRGDRCLICGSKDLRIFLAYWRRPLLECAACDLRFAAVVPGGRKLRRMHNEVYWQMMYEHLGCAGNAAAWEDWKKWKEALLKDFGVSLSLETAGQKKVLDVGCGNGALLEMFLDRGWKCTGIDFSDFIKKISFPAEMEIIQGGFEDVNLPENSFDAVTLIHTLEHAARPDTFLKKAKDALKDDGFLLVELPFSPDYSQMHHQYFFSRKSIGCLTAGCGIRIEKERIYQDSLHADRENLNIVLLCRKH